MHPLRFHLLAPAVAAAALTLFSCTRAVSQTAPLPPTTSASAVLLPGDAAALPPVAPADAPSAAGNGPRDDVIRDAHDAFVRHDRVRLAALRGTAIAIHHPLAPWADYWELANRLGEVNADEVDAFFARWPGTYVEDRLRDDWLLELGRRQDWATFGRVVPHFRMNDDREVACYVTLVDHLAGKDVRDVARTQWFAQKDADNGCQLLAQTLYDDKVFTDDDVWRRVRQAAEFGRPRAARAAAQILGKPALKEVGTIWDNPAHWLAHRPDAATARRADLVTIALVRMAASDAGATAVQMTEHWQGALDSDMTAWTWAVIAKQGAQSLMPEAVDWQERAWAALKPRKGAAADAPDWDDDLLAWHARAALRFGAGPQRWRDIARSIDAMSATERAEPNWVYWRAQAAIALAKDNADGEAARTAARATLNQLSANVSFYGLLAAEDLGSVFVLPPRPIPVTPLEHGLAHANAGLQRALALVSLDLRDEGRREWNYTLRGMNDRELLAAAQWACDLSEWQLCINTSERTKGEIDIGQRYPMPFQRDIAAAARNAGLEPAFVFGLIRQETRFMGQMRSAVGASGMMQLMPATAKWAAHKAGIAYQADMISDPDTNLRIGSFYLKLVLDSFGGSQPMAAAAYNAGPARPRRWRGTVMVDPAIWAENVPFFETRDYVKKVMTNAAVYAALLGNKPPLLRQRLGSQIGPRDAEQPPSPDMP